MAKNKKTVTLEEAKEEVRKVCKRLALLHLSFAKTILEEMGEEKGKKIILKAIKSYGESIGGKIKDTISKEGLTNKPENYKEDLPLYGMHEKSEIVTEVNGEKKRRAYGCVMGEFWKELDENKIGRYYCYVDLAKYMGFNPDFKLIHTRTILDGDDFCEFKIKSTTEPERKDFFEKNEDWSYMDK